MAPSRKTVNPQILVGWDEFVILTRERLHLRRGEYPTLAEAAGVSLRWVRSFAAAEYPGTHTGWVFALAAALGLPARVAIEGEGSLQTGRSQPRPVARLGARS